MSGFNARGAHQRAIIRQKQRPEYSGQPPGPRSMKKMSSIDVVVPPPGPPRDGDRTRIKIGIRVRTEQVIDRLVVKQRGNDLRVWKEDEPFPAGEPPLSGGQPPIREQLQAICSTAGERWVGFIAVFEGELHGQKDFETQLFLTGVETIPRNGFQPVAIAFTTEAIRFEDGHYVVATSVLPGEGSTFVHTTIAPGGLSRAKEAAGPRGAKGKVSRAKPPAAPRKARRPKRR